MTNRPTGPEYTPSATTPVPARAEESGSMSSPLTRGVAGDDPDIVHTARRALGGGRDVQAETARQMDEVGGVDLKAEASRLRAARKERTARLVEHAQDAYMLGGLEKASQQHIAAEYGAKAVDTFFDGLSGVFEGFFGKEGTQSLRTFLQLMKKLFRKAPEAAMAMAESAVMKAVDENPNLSKDDKEKLLNKWDKWKKDHEMEPSKSVSEPGISSAEQVRRHAKKAERQERVAQDERESWESHGAAGAGRSNDGGRGR